ncbi:hypothetical protein HRI_000288600 [Hibiscus trionum]|uniref:Endonuclease/exonuclease/phosphatase domain-containing protein n=1 Tax=Hibiscus trionum TaxID=183268 RepID=A0A9W7GVW9_HIBTR|nr:hypothetical protein HRI_000288600 [Hibiscus trionum]
MSILAWNIRGVGNRKSVRALQNSIFKIKPTVIFLSETKQNKRYLEKIKMKMKMDCSFYVEPQGLAGGLALWWKTEADVTILGYDQNLIDTKIRLQEGDSWYNTFIYGPPNKENRQEFWKNLSKCRENLQDKWVIIGDSNTVACQEDKEGGNPVNPSETKWYTDFIDSSGMIEVPIKGGKFSWYNQRGGEHAILEKLDRILCSPEWSFAFPKAMGVMEITTASDHTPIVLLTKGLSRKYKRDFRFETKWLLEKDCSQTVDRGWNIAPGERVMSRFRRKIHSTQNTLLKWNKEKMKKRNERKQILMDGLSKLQGRKLSERELEEYKRMKKELDAEWESEERYWHQISRVNWLKWGDKNTKFFHATTIQHRRANSIVKIKHENGSWLEEPEEIATYLLQHFQQVFMKDHSIDTCQLKDIIPRVVTTEMNTTLCKPIDEEEIKKAVFDMGATKAPGPDGFPSCFYQTFWNTVKVDLIGMITAFFKEGELDPTINKNNIVLIPKKANPTEVSHLRPISLCNFSLKVITKVLATRLKVFLPDLIPQYQSAFVKGRAIHDNIILANEACHAIKRTRK